MASSRKSRKIEKDGTSESEDGSDADAVEEEPMESIQVDFDVKLPEESDFHGIKNLLNQLFLKAHVNTSELTDLLIGQSKITSVVKQAIDDDMEVDDEDDQDTVFGVFSVVNLSDNTELECLKQVKTYLLSHCKQAGSDGELETLQRVFDDKTKKVGFIVSERMVNIPPSIAPPLYSSLSQDMAKAASKGKPFDFDYYLFICKIVAFKENRNQETIVYANAEEELISEVASLTYDFSVSKELDSGLAGNWTDEDKEGQRKRRVFVVPSSQWDTMYTKIVEALRT